MSLPSELERAVKSEIIALAPFLAKDVSIPVTVGVSGGSDSLALALLLQASGLNVTALLVDHALRPEAAFEASSTAEFLLSKGIKARVIMLKKDEYPKGRGIQERARRARMKALEEVSYEVGSPCLFLGHQKNDLLETVAFREEKASLSEGLSGIHQVSILGRVAILRPLLGYTRDSLKTYLRSRGIGWISDPSNENRKYARVRIRQDMTFEEEKRLGRLQHSSEQETKILDALFSKIYTKYVRWCSWGGFKVDKEAFDSLNRDEGTLFLRKLISFISTQHPPAYAAVESIRDQRASTIAGVRIEERKGILFLAPEMRIKPEEVVASHNALFDSRWRYVGESKNDFSIGYLGEDVSLLKRGRELPAFCLRALPVLRDGREIVALSAAYDGEHHFYKAKFSWNGKPPLLRE